MKKGLRGVKLILLKGYKKKEIGGMKQNEMILVRKGFKKENKQKKQRKESGGWF